MPICLPLKQIDILLLLCYYCLWNPQIQFLNWPICQVNYYSLHQNWNWICGHINGRRKALLVSELENPYLTRHLLYYIFSSGIFARLEFHRFENGIHIFLKGLLFTTSVHVALIKSRGYKPKLGSCRWLFYMYTTYYI